MIFEAYGTSSFVISQGVKQILVKGNLLNAEVDHSSVFCKTTICAAALAPGSSSPVRHPPTYSHKWYRETFHHKSSTQSWSDHFHNLFRHQQTRATPSSRNFWAKIKLPPLTESFKHLTSKVSRL